METRAQFGAVPRAVIVFATLALLTALAAGAIVVGSSSGPNLPPAFGAAGNGLIAYESGGHVWTVNPDGSDAKQITTGPELEGGPAWSRDGTRLAYWSGPEDGPGNLILTDAEGKDPITVATTLGPDYERIEWSADGTEIMYSEIVPGLDADPCPFSTDNGGACESRLFIADVDGAGSRQVGDSDLDARGPTLSPDGVKVAFGGGEAASEALYLMDWDGSNIERLDTGIVGGYWSFVNQSWSPGGTQIVTHGEGSGTRVWIVELDGTGVAQAPTRAGFGFWPSYSPDGSGIDWATDSGPIIYTPGDEEASVRMVGIGETKWSPDSTKLVGVRGDDLVIFDRDGENITEIAAADESNPSWQRVFVEE
jgi:Tol biopolymer transport system component